MQGAGLLLNNVRPASPVTWSSSSPRLVSSPHAESPTPTCGSGGPLVVSGRHSPVEPLSPDYRPLAREAQGPQAREAPAEVQVQVQVQVHF